MHFCWPGVGTFKWTISACKRKIYLILTLLSVTLFVLDYRASQELCVLPTALPQLVTNLHSSIVGVQFSAGSLLSHRYVAAATNTASTIYRMVMRWRVHCTTATKKGVSVSESVQLPSLRTRSIYREQRPASRIGMQDDDVYVRQKPRPTFTRLGNDQKSIVITSS